MKKSKRWLALLLAGLLAVPNVGVYAEELSDGAVVEEIASEELPVVGDTTVIEVPDPIRITDLTTSPEDGTFMHSGDTLSVSFQVTGTTELPKSGELYWWVKYLTESGNIGGKSVYFDFSLDSESEQYHFDSTFDYGWCDSNGSTIIFDKDTRRFTFAIKIKKSADYQINEGRSYLSFENERVSSGYYYPGVYIDDDCADGKHTIRSDTEPTIDKSATCTEPGSQSKHCIKCNSIVEETVEEIPALGHEWREDYRNEPTCGWDGYIRYYCTRCWTNKTEPIPATGEHTPEEIEAEEPTCTHAGHTAGSRCSVCGKLLEGTEEIPMIDHDWEERYYTTEPTCTEDGEMAYRCTKCYQWKYEKVRAKGHQYENVEKKYPTCTESGWTEGVRCSVCGDMKEGEELPTLEHSWVERGRDEPGCTYNGRINYQCSRCDQWKYESIPATGHNPVEVEAKESTCTEQGWTKGVRCANCGYMFEGEKLPLADHKWVENYSSGRCPNGRYVEYECSVCGEWKSERLEPSEHTWSDWYKIDPVYEDEDNDYIWEERKCSVCGETERRHGDEICTHDWGEWVTIQDEENYSYVERTCSICRKKERHGEDDPFIVIRVYDPNYDVFEFTVQVLDSSGKVFGEFQVYSNRESSQLQEWINGLKLNEVYTIKALNVPSIFKPVQDTTICFNKDYEVDYDKTTANISGRLITINLEHVETTPTPTPTPQPYEPDIIYVPVTPTPIPTDHEAYIPPIEECSVTGIEERYYAPAKYYSFKGIGASAETKYSVRTIGDGMWIPAGWSFDEAGEDIDTRFKLGHDDGIEAGTHDLYVWFRLFKWDGTNWVATNITKSIKTQFTALEAPDPTPTPEPEPEVTSPKTVITKLEDTGSGNLRIYWRSMGDQVDGYQIRWSTNKDMTGMKTATYTGINNTTRPNLSLGKVYYVGVRTFVMNDGKKVYSEWSGTKAIKLTRTLATPSVSGADQKGTGIQTKWFTVADAEGYQLRFCQNASFKGARTASVTGQNKTSFTKYGLGSGTWYVAVRAYKTAEDGVRYYSAWSGTQLVTL